ncbi:MAG: RIO1 family regulatory kinase/ATPase domain-containing protein [Acidimicrobiales bacterium]
MSFADADPAARPAPDWLPTGRVVDETIGLLKTGKEAEVFVVERRSLDDGRSCLLAEKRYRPLSVGKGELEAGGFSRARTFVDDTIYHEGRRFRRSRDRRAVETMTARGKMLLGQRWIRHEHDVLVTLWRAGAAVPYPVEVSGESLYMELIGDAEQAAPRLATARLSPDQLASAFDQLVETLHRMTGEAIVHADLSAFNLLWWRDRLIVIDLPQAAELLHNPNGFALLHRDVERICEWFRRKGLDRDPDEVFAQLLESAW